MRKLVATTLAGVVWFVGALQADTPREYQVKAAFLYNVMKFVTWPDSGRGPDEGPVSVAVLGLGAAPDMEAILSDKLLGGRPIVVRGYARGTEVRPSHVLYIVADAHDQQHAALASAEGAAVLTVTEAADATLPAPVITLSVSQTRLTFEVNLDSAEAHGLVLSSKLLGLAKSVRSDRLHGRPSAALAPPHITTWSFKTHADRSLRGAATPHF